MSALSSAAQDVHFTQWEASEMNFNPAQAGNFEGDWQVSSVYRNQWKAIGRPFTTFATSYASKLYFLPQGWSAAGMVLSDRSGSLIEMKNDQVHLGVQYQFRVGGSILSTGVQSSYTVRGLDWSQVSHPDQFNANIGLFDSGLPTQESSQNQQLKYFDMQVGLLWSKYSETITYEAGLGLFHLLGPSDSFFGNDATLPVRVSSHASATYHFQTDRYVSGEIRDTHHARASALLLKTTYGILLENEKNGIKEVYGSLLHRNGIKRNSDAIMVGIGAATRTMRFMVAYDVNISSLELATGNKGGIEVGFIYTSPSSFSEHITIPCDRF